MAVVTVPNGLTILRMLLVAVAWVPALEGRRVPVAILAAIAGTTDVLDGIVARATRRSSRLGSQLDSIADLALTVSTVAWLYLLVPAFINENLPVLLAWLGVGALALLVGLLRFSRIGDLHLLSAKVAGVVAYLFVLALLLTGTYSRIIFMGVLAVCFIATTESLLVLALASHEERRARPASVLPLVRRRLRSWSKGGSTPGPR